MSAVERTPRSGVEVDYDPFATGALARAVPTTDPQREVWLADKLGREASLAYNESVLLRLRGPLDRAALLASLQDLVDRHESLRATLGPDGEQFCIAERLTLDTPFVDIASLPPPERDARMRAAERAAVDEPFEIERGPLVRTSLLRVAADDHVLLITAHHIVCDGWSFWVIVRELANGYARRTVAQAPPLSPADSFADYAIEQAEHSRSAEVADDERYWLSRFPGEAPVLDLPVDRPRPARRTFASGREDVTLDAALMADVRKLGARRGASFYATLLAGFAALMQRLSGQRAVVIGIPAAGQSQGGHDALVGHAVHLLPMRIDVDPDASFQQQLDAARGALLDAYDHQRCTFGRLLGRLRIARDPGRVPLVSVMFNIDQALEGEAASFPGLELEFSTNARTHENFELFVNAVQAHGALRLECQYHSELYDAGTIKCWMAAFECLLRDAVARPDAPCGSLHLVSTSAQTELAVLQPAPTPLHSSRLLHELVEAQADRTPGRIGARSGGEWLDHAALDARANRIAHVLRARGIGRGALVGLCVERGLDMLAAVLGVLKSGAAYVPLDSAFPAERLSYMAGDAHLALLVTTSELAGLIEWPRERSLLLDADAATIEAAPATRLGRDAQAAEPESVAYVLYTSGSTGRPKGVQVPHRALVNFLSSMQREPGLGAEDRLVAVTTLSFDIAVLELILPLTVGAQVIIASREQAGDGHALLALIEAGKATVMQATPSTWRLLLEAGWHGDARFKALVGGEALPADLAMQLRARCAEVWNMYGPTETTVWSTCWKVERPEQGISIGRPIANTTVWILDEHRQLCPIGVPGEIWIGGDGVTLGYLNRPELTAERFVADPYAARPGATLYRTGDRGRWLANGTLEHLGRLDFQVKVRGYRIELGEIEAQLAAHASVARAVVTVREESPGDVRLVAYVVPAPGASLDEAALRAHLKSALPDYMIPQHVLALAALPLTPNGKIDRKALPAPDRVASGTGADSIAPRDELERVIAAAMEAVLSRGPIGIHDNFFDLGGHSILAAQLVARLNRERDLGLRLRAIFDAPTVEGLAAAVRPDSGVRAPAARRQIAQRVDQTTAPMSLMQQRLWFLDALDPGRTVYNTPSAHRLHGALDADAFERAFREVVRRQPMLRTAIVPDGELAVQQVLPEIPVALLPPEDLSYLVGAAREAELQRRLDALIAQPFDLGRAPLFRARLFRLGPEQHVLFFMAHHIIWDGWSFDLLYAEMSALYGAFSAGKPSPLPELALTYGDFSAWQFEWLQGGELATQLEHWRGLLAGELEPLALPGDRPRPARMSGSGRTEWLTLPKAIVDAARALGRRADATLFMTLMAVYYLLLHRLSGQRDLIVGTPVRGRDGPELECIMGFFVNALPIRLRVDPGRTFREFLRDVRAVVLDAFNHPDVPFEHLVHALRVPRDESRSPIYQAFFSFQDVRRRLTGWGNLRHERTRQFQGGVAEDLGLWFVERDEGIIGGLTYNTDILDRDSAVRLHQRYFALLASAIADPSLPIAELGLLPDDERRSLDQWNVAAAAYPRAALLHELVEAQADRTPGRIGARSGGEWLDHAALDARANRIAHVLRARGIGRGALVGLCVERGLDMLAAVLGVLKSGAAYVPLDSAFPAERLSYMAGDAHLALLVTTSELAGLIEWPRERSLLLDADAATIEAAPATRLGRDAQAAEPESVAYVLYTSGSTGRPKGVQVPHRALVNFLSSMQREPGLGAEDRLVAVTTLSFDIAVLELILPLTVGAQVIIASREQAGDGHALLALIEAGKATVMQATPSTWRLLLEAGWHGDARFKALVGGEALPADLAMQLRARCAEVWNMYGPTETTVWSTCWKVERPEQGISIGRPIANTTVWILDEHRQLCPIGVPGEIWIGGDGVTLGYLNRPELTAERFVADPYAARPGATLYRTGDRGRWLANGTLEHLGRLDFQVKVRGYRIELGEIEAQLAAHASVARAVVTVREESPGDVRLVAYVVPAPGASLDEAALRAHLKSALPDYMIPQHVLALAALPLTPNGKIDRKALPAPAWAQSAAAGEAYEEPHNRTERQLAAVWRDLLGVRRVGTHDNFFDLGGHSLLAMQAIARMETATGKRVNPRRFIFQTLAQLANSYDEAPSPLPAGGGLLRRILGAMRKRKGRAGAG